MSRWILVPLWAICLFAFCFTLQTQRNQFPYHYHPDEPGKVEQVIEGNWNFHHPILLLGTVKTIIKALKIEPLPQPVVEIGRSVSAAFIAASIVALSLLGWYWRGWPTCLLAGLLLGTEHQLFELAHYFKEDSALLLGMSLAALATPLYSDRPSALRAALLGLACATAVSGKYIGAISLLFALPVLYRHRARGAWLAFGLALLAGFLVINWPLFAEFTTFRQSFGREVALVVEGQGGTTQRVPHTEYWTIFRDNSTPATWLLLAVYLFCRWRQRRSLTTAEWVLTLFPILYTLALSFSPKANDRYFLPVTAWICLFAAIGAADLATLWPKRGVWITSALVALAAQFPDWSNSHPGWLTYYQAFGRDDNADLVAYLRSEVPPTAVVLKDNRISLPIADKKKHASRTDTVPQRIIAKRYAADAGELSQLAASGITHVIVSETDYGKFFRESLIPKAGQEDSFARRRRFYSELFANSNQATLVWDRERSTVIYLHPGIRVYRLNRSD